MKGTTRFRYRLDHCNQLFFQSHNLLALRSNQVKLHHCHSSVSTVFLIHLPSIEDAKNLSPALSLGGCL